MQASKFTGNPGRRRFMGMGLLSAAAALLPSGSTTADCPPTTSDILGPYYVDNPPLRTRIAAPEEPGERLLFAGRVLARDCATPLEGAIVDIWQANDDGCYSVRQNCAPNLLNMNLRGQTLTNARGEFAFETIRPGFYLNGAQFRPAHIHARVVTPDDEILITQVYFEGDPYIANDPWASDPDASERIISLAKVNEEFRGNIDFTMRAAVPVSVAPPESRPELLALHQNYPNPFAESTTIRFSLPQASQTRLSVFDSFGRHIADLLDRKLPAGYHQVGWRGRDGSGKRLAAGSYLYRLTAVNAFGSFEQMKALVYLG